MLTLGRYGGKFSIFSYKRTSKGIHIEGPLNAGGKSKTKTFDITNAEWAEILRRIELADYKTFRIREGESEEVSQNTQTVSEIIHDVLKKRDNTRDSYVAAILVHEGSLEPWSGSLGQGESSPIQLRKDI